jgi:hypothetical protein
MPVTLQQGGKYVGQFIINHSCFVLGMGGGADAVRAELEKNGWTQVSVWLDAGALPSDWFANMRDDPSGSGECPAWAAGVWGRPTQTVATEGEQWRLYKLQAVQLPAPPPTPQPAQPTPAQPGQPPAPQPPPAPVPSTTTPVFVSNAPPKTAHPTWIEIGSMAAGAVVAGLFIRGRFSRVAS